MPAAASSEPGGALTRFGLRAFLVLFGAIAGFAIGATFSVAFLISPGAGLAGVAEVVVYGGLAAILAGVATAFGVARLGSRTLRWAALIAALALAAQIAWAVLSQSAQVEEPAPDRPTAAPAQPVQPAPEGAS